MKKLIAFLIVAFYVVPLFAGMSPGIFTLPTGTNGQVLTYDDTQPDNVKFATPSSGGAQDLDGFAREMLLQIPTWTLSPDLSELLSGASQGSWTADVADITEANAFTAGPPFVWDTTAVSAAKARYTKAAGFSFSTGATYEITCAVTTSAAADSRCVLGYMGDATASDSVYFAASTTGVIVYGTANISISLDTTASHTYRMCVKDTTWRLYVDDVFMAQGVVLTSGGADLVYLGDYNAGAGNNSVVTVTSLSYYTGASSHNYDKFHLTADTIYVGSTKLTSVDETINLTDDLDTGSAATSTVYNIELLADGTLQFTTDATTTGRFVGGVLTDSATATYFIPTRWDKNICYFNGTSVLAGPQLAAISLTTTESSFALRGLLPATAEMWCGHNSMSGSGDQYFNPVSGAGSASIYRNTVSPVKQMISMPMYERVYYVGTATSTAAFYWAYYTEKI